MWDYDTNIRLYKEGDDEFRDENLNVAQLSVKLQEAKVDKIIVLIFQNIVDYLCSLNCVVCRALLSRASETE